VEVWVHPTRRFYDAVDTLKAELKEGARPVLRALAEAFAQLKNDPWTFARSEDPQASGGSFAHVFYPGFVLTYRIQAGFQGEATLIRQQVYLKNILRQN
jgi:hypothetical protein